jgi:hypothetical protein
VTPRPITRAEYDDLAARDPYYRKRWAYFSLAGAMVRVLEREHSITRALEVGPGPRGGGFLVGADTLDLRGAPTFKHDAGVEPWPVPDQAYDLVVALQVWEHLRGRQLEAFHEAMRVARFVLLSFPYRWRDTNDEHRMITSETIAAWTCDAPMLRRVLCREPSHRMRLLALFGGRP